MDEVMQNTNRLFNHKWFKKIYADDLAAIMEKKYLCEFIRIIKNEFNKYNLIFNDKKSQIKIIRSSDNDNDNDNVKEHQITLKKIEGLEIVKSYNYLGV
jgi:hypothetical protein